MKNNKGFTLIEILAVIIVLGIIMIIAIPAVTQNISDSRSTTYITTINKFIDTAMAEVTAFEYSVSNKDYTYYIPTKCLATQGQTNESSYGDFLESYVVVTYNDTDKKNDYYYTGVDESGHGILLSYRDLIDESSIKTDLKSIDNKIGVGSRPYIYIYSDSCNKTRDKFDAVLANNIPERGSMKKQNNSINSAVVYPTGKTKDTVVTGDIVTIDTEEFYVVKRDGSDLILLSHYNLKVGSIYNRSYSKTGEYTSSDTGYGLQSSEAKGWVSGASSFNGTVAFSSTNYWNGKVGTDYSGSYCSSNIYTSGTNCVYVYDANSNLKTYVDSYKTYLEGKGATIKSARLLRVEEAFELGCGNGAWNCNNAPAFLKETSYWLGSARSADTVWDVYSRGSFDSNSYDYGYSFGVRPVIVI